MPTIANVEGHRFYLYSHEPNEPPHVHVDRGSASLKVWLEPVAVARIQGFRPHEIGRILALVRQRRAMFLESWYGHFSTRG